MELSASSAALACRRAFRSSIVLASQTVQVTIEATTRPTMTAFTTTSAFMNMPHGDRSRGRTASSFDGRKLLLRERPRTSARVRAATAQA